MKIGMLGEGAWGTAIATLLAKNGHEVLMWCYHEDTAHQIEHERCNDRYMPGISIHNNITPTNDLATVIRSSDWIFEAIPVKYLRSVITQAKEHARTDQVWVVLSKGIENNTLHTPTELLNEILGYSAKSLVLAGPGFAKEVIDEQITGVAIASEQDHITTQLAKLVNNRYFKTYPTDDLIGTQWSSALKNVIALATGFLDGAGYGFNTKAFFITRGLHNVANFVQFNGGKRETVYDLPGIGDIILTCLCTASKNLQVGQQLGKGKSLDLILKETNYIPEGINTLQSIQQYSAQKKLDMPFFIKIYDIIFNNIPIHDMLQSDIDM